MARTIDADRAGSTEFRVTVYGYVDHGGDLPDGVALLSSGEVFTDTDGPPDTWRALDEWCLTRERIPTAEEAERWATEQLDRLDDAHFAEIEEWYWTADRYPDDDYGTVEDAADEKVRSWQIYR